MAGSVNEIADRELIRRAIADANVSPRSSRSRRVPLWKKVGDRFMLGSTYAWQLCERHGFNPDNEVRP